MIQFFARLILICTASALAACANDQANSPLAVKSGDFGLQFVFCTSGQKFNFQSEAVALTSAGAYEYRQIYLHPPGDPNPVSCRFDSTGQVKVNDGTMRTKYDNRTLIFASDSQVHFRGEIDGEVCTFEYHRKVTFRDDEMALGDSCP